ncbi:MAG TPA: hypothetical protein DCY79_02080 [Planctomycetaceae bacterium]|nr:hypothetical protein [Blastopirellula sp.]HAY78577.1 hypothetical protein [Planctomycetaceae bacterium]
MLASTSEGTPQELLALIGLAIKLQSHSIGEPHNMSIILIVSVSIRALAAIWSVAVMVRLRDRRILFLTAMLVLMATRQALTLAAKISSDANLSLDFAANPDEIPGLVVTLMAFLLVLNLEGMIKGRRQVVATAQRSPGIPILPPLGIGLASILGIVTVSLVAYLISQNAIRRIVADDNLALGQTVCNVALQEEGSEGSLARSAALARIRHTWSQTSLPYAGSHLSVIGPAGTVELDTGHPDWQGKDVGNMPTSPGSDETLLELLHTQGSWSGRTFDPSGSPQLAGYHYEPAIKSLVSVRTPLKMVDDGFRTAVAPWIAGIALIGGLLLPLSLGLLFHSSRQAHTEAISSLTALQESEEKFRVLTERNPAIVLITRNNEIVYGNSMLSTITGYTASELIGLQISVLLHPEHRKLLADIQEQEPAKPHDEEMMIITKAGEHRWLEMSSQWIDFEGEPAMLVTCLDLTRRKQAEQQLRQKESQLAHVSRLSAMGEMVAGIAHEINQPLSAIANFAIASKNELKQTNCELEQPVDSWLDKINEQALACGEIILRLRNFAIKGDGIRQSTDLNQVIRDSLALLNNEIRHGSITIHLQLPDSETVVHGNPTEFQQVVVNLLRNACEAVKQEDSPEIKIHVQQHADSVQLTIEDNGPGIEEARQQHIFDAFFTTKSHGMGMGLAISKSLIEAYDGTLRHEAGGRGGAIFHVELPIGKPKSPMP